MITKQEAFEIAKKYVVARGRSYTKFVSVDDIFYEEQKRVGYGKYEDKKRNIFTVTYYTEGYIEDHPNFVEVDALTGEVLFTIFSQGYVEARENF